MEISTDLVTSLVVLATALLGLYKVAGADVHESMGERIREAIGIIIIPAAMLALLWLFTSVLPNMMSSATKYEPTPINHGADDAEQMLAITKRFWKQDMRQDALKLTIEHALATGRYDIAVEAAADLNPTGQADDVRMRAIKALAGEQQQALWQE
ncbi:MAG: hypothetical protein P1U75_19555 [Antarcticimicrobium sp.]|uniref:hypothetical protein n=1 Tax=Antarcticimicrobium sp. TaxID=2824147 RepID=UPI002608D31E|nr:hypothetical protein [Antarcticimicrobium sp.]MDF1718837.1 hypothetical protein [Antarcticimicrobium sp.]